MSPFKTLTRVLAIVGKELVSIVRRPGALLSLVLGPFLIMAIFAAGYNGTRRPLHTIVVLPVNSGLPTDVATYQTIGGEGLVVDEITTDEQPALDRLDRQEVDVVVVAPADAQKAIEEGRKATIEVRVNLTDPTAAGYATFLARGLEAAVNRQIIEEAIERGKAQAIQAGAADMSHINAPAIAAPTQATLDNRAQSTPTIVQYFAPAVLAMILQHLSVTLIALSVVRERNSGLFELFRISPITTAELVTGKLIAYGIFAGIVAVTTIALLALGFHVPMLARPGWIALVAGVLIAASLGLGLVVAAVSDSEPQAVQLSLLVLLASVFFSGFILAINEFSEPVRSLIYVLPVANGIRLLQDFMFRGGTVVLWQFWLLVGLGVGYLFVAWLLLRRAIARA
ncbi:MAG TPA: ABC transporter permease [Candidatus Limnocylindrales bacterium]